MHSDKPYSPACERNRDPILAVLRGTFATRRRVLEVGSGTGQHAVHFAAGLPHLIWQSSDRAEYLPGIRAWLAEAGLPNTPAPLELDVMEGGWPEEGEFDALFMANTLHIMSWAMVEACFERVNHALAGEAALVVYGPFKRQGQNTSDSNAAFDADLKRRDPVMGIRDIESIAALAESVGFDGGEIHSLPANNLCLVFRRGA
jgi:SAM-dependent methyltransferase